MLRLSDDIHLVVSYGDHSRFGAYPSGRFDAELRRRFVTVRAAVEERSLVHAIHDSRAVLREAFAHPEIEDLFVGPGTLREEVLHPDPAAVRPIGLQVYRGGRKICSLPLAPAIVGSLAGWVGAWERGASRPREAQAAELWDSLVEAGVLVEVTPIEERPLPPLLQVGHATVRVEHEGRAVLVDPFVRSAGRPYPTAGPLSLRELMPIDAVVITHSHPDHYDLGALLRLGAEVPIYVPAVARESILSIDMGQRLRELGFSRVQEVEWWTSFDVGAMRLTALPFFGEQPSDGARLHPEVRNQGNTYHLRQGTRSVMFTADSGRDDQGSLRELSVKVRERLGPVDVLLGGHRGFCVYPLQYLYTSVPAYLLFVPPSLWGTRQQVMADGDDLLDAAETLEAQLTIPYAGGGAPWLWDLGLGPALDGRRNLSRAVDPEPQSLSFLARQRSSSNSAGLISSATRVEILHPGDGITLRDLSVVRGRPWPYCVGSDLDELPAFLERYRGDPWTRQPGTAITPSGDCVAAAKKKGLLGLLARRYAAESGFFPTPEQVQSTSDNVRVRFGLDSRQAILEYFEEQGLDAMTWREMMTDIAAIDLVESRHRKAVLARLPAVVKAWAARGRRATEVAS